MLQSIRDRASGWIAWVVIILIGAAFALFGLSNYMGPGGTPRAIATVNGEPISRDAASRAYREQLGQLERQYGGQLDVTEEIEREVRRRSLEQLVNQRLLVDYIDDHDLTISDDDLAAIIRNQEVFQQDGRFSRELYERVLRANQMSSAQYEAHQRRSAVQEQIRAGVMDTAFVTERELEARLRLEAQERELAWVRIDHEPWLDQVDVDETTVEAYFNERQERFVEPERVRLRYVELQAEALLDRVEVSDSEIEQRYEQVRDRYTTETIREARHILLRLDEDADDEEVEAARERIEELAERIRDGESFAELAEAYSEDPGSAREGGALGRVEQGDMVEPFEDALFDLGEGELSGPVRTPFGYHLIEASRVEGGETASLEEVRDEIREELARERIRQVYFEELNRLDDLAYDRPNELDSVAEDLGLELQETDWVSREGADEGIAAHREVLEAAFGPEVLEERRNSPVIELEEDHAVVLRVADHRPEREQELDEVREQVEAAVRQQQAADAARERAEALRQAVADGEDPETAAAELEGATHESPGWIDRQWDGAPPALVNAVFGMARPADGDRVTEIISGPSTEVVLILRGVRDGDPEDVGPERRDELRAAMRNAYANEAISQFMGELRARADVEIHDEDYR